MNYALDAVWWRLQTPAVRDLASLLTAPPPWSSGAELPVPVLLGATGFRYLLALDEMPQRLQAWLDARTPFGGRLGKYAEALLAFWFAHAPHAELLAHDLAVCQHGRTVGAADFVVRLNGVPYHLELACKYYGGGGGSVTDFVGLDPQDCLADKAEKIQQQLCLSQQADFRTALRAAGVTAWPLRRATVVRGMVFVPQAEQPLPAPINHLAWQGVWGSDWATIKTQLPAEAVLWRFAPVARMAQLSPVRLSEQAAPIWDWGEVQTLSRGMVVALQRRQDGFWHEVVRLMKVMVASS